MNRLIVEPDDFIAPNRVRVTGRRARQLVEVIKVGVGTFCKAGVVDGKTGRAEVCEIAPDGSVVLELELDGVPPVPLDTVLAAALPRPQTFAKVLHIATTFGVKEIVFFHSFKVEKSYWQSPRIRPENFRSILLEALEQCGDTVLPRVSFCPQFRQFAETELPRLGAGREILIGHPEDRAGDAPSGLPTALVIGPEGGFTEREVAALLQLPNSRLLSLGPRVLRTEYALAALLGKIPQKLTVSRKGVHALRFAWVTVHFWGDPRAPHFQCSPLARLRLSVLRVL